MRRSQHLFLEIPHTETLATWSQRTRLRSEEHTSELQSPCNLVCRLLLEKKKPHTSKRSSWIRVPPASARARAMAPSSKAQPTEVKSLTLRAAHTISDHLTKPTPAARTSA